jgi:hypothetical protein
MPLTWEENPEGGLDFTEWELLEWSLVPIPMNQEALRLAVQRMDRSHGLPVQLASAKLPPDLSWGIAAEAIEARIAELQQEALADPRSALQHDHRPQESDHDHSHLGPEAMVARIWTSGYAQDLMTSYQDPGEMTTTTPLPENTTGEIDGPYRYIDISDNVSGSDPGPTADDVIEPTEPTPLSPEALAALAELLKELREELE